MVFLEMTEICTARRGVRFVAVRKMNDGKATMRCMTLKIHHYFYF